jgi:hypothetical protein
LTRGDDLRATSGKQIEARRKNFMASGNPLGPSGALIPDGLDKGSGWTID